MKTEVKREILKQTFLWGFFISSFLIWPWSSFIYELPRIWFVRIWIEALLLFGLFFVQAYENSRNKFSELIWFCALVINVFVVLLSKSLGGIIGILLLIAGIFLKNTALSKRQIFYTLLFSGILLGATFFFIKISGPFTFESRERILMRGVNAFT